MLESLFNKVAGLRLPSHVFNQFFFQRKCRIASTHSILLYAPIFLEDLPVIASIFRNLFTLHKNYLVLPIFKINLGVPKVEDKMMITTTRAINSNS